MQFFPILTLVIVLAAGFTILIRTRSKGYGQEFEDFVKEEAEANAARGKALDPAMFFTPNMEGLPFAPDKGGEPCSHAIRRQREVLKRAGKQMVRFDAPRTNTELKHMFGAVNLESISTYEEHFFAYTYAMNDWAEALLNEGCETDAMAVLRRAAEDFSETSKTYTLLADLYYKHNMRGEMLWLYETVSQRRMPAQEKIWAHVNDCFNKMKL